MSHELAQSRLCRLIDDSLRPYPQLVSGSLNPAVVKDLLISLSQVYRQIKQWTLELESDSDSDDGTTEKTANISDASVCSGSDTYDHRCMAKIVAQFMSLLSLEKPLIQHLTGNILVAIAELAAATETGLAQYMHLLCDWLKFAIRNTLIASDDQEVSRAKDLDFGSSITVLSMKLRVEDATYLFVASIIRVLRNVLKLLKLNMNDRLLKVYLHSITDIFSNLPWDSLNEVYVMSNGESPVASVGNDLLCKSAARLKSIGIFHGNLFQLFCSLVDISGRTGAGAGSDTHHVVFQIRNLIPKILAGCFDRLDNVPLFHYLKYKILMLLMRLTFIVHLEHSDLIMWLHLIEKYFQDLLLQPLQMLESNLDGSQESSPFWAGDIGTERPKMSSCHLQRLAIFLFLRCSFILVSLKVKADEQFTVANSNFCLNSDFHFSSECSSRSEGLSMLQQWLQMHLPTDILVNNELYSQRCRSFELSFLKLYMHEDDILFEMLLQLFHLPFYSKKWIDIGGTSSTAKKDMVCLLSDLFNPIHFFHLFLAEILYDHQVLLDYLISKDTGAKSAEYLLRCLRLVCDSWNLFVEFSTWEDSPNSSRLKRRRVLVDSMGFGDSWYPPPLEDDLVSSAIESEDKNNSKHGRTKRVSVEDAKGCLLCLRTSIDSLYQKNLFPYNPEVLLRRLSRFQELCLKEIQVPTAC